MYPRSIPRRLDVAFLLSLSLLLLLLLAASVACSGVVSGKAAADLARSRATATLGVYPVLVHKGEIFEPDAAETSRLVAALGGAGFAAVVPAAGRPPEIRTAWQMDEARIFRQSAEALTEHLRAAPPAEPYVLYVEYLMSPEGGELLAAHWMVADREGRIAAGAMLNSHDDSFHDAMPVTPEEGRGLVAVAIREAAAKGGRG